MSSPSPGDAVAGQWLGPMPVDLFLNDFVPGIQHLPRIAPERYSSLFASASYTTEGELGADLAAIFRILTPSLLWAVVNPNNILDRGKMPELIAYRSDSQLTSRAPQMGDVELMVTLRACDISGGCDPFNDQGNLQTFQPTNMESKQCREQISSHLTSWFNHQFRTHGFKLYIGDPMVRIIRVDRAGAIVTKAFNFRERADILVNFLRQFDRLRDGQRGRDTTVRLANQQEIAQARTVFNKLDDPESVPFIVVSVPDGLAYRPLLALPPNGHGHTEPFPSTALRTFVAYDILSSRLVLCKDSWRPMVRNIEGEADILRRLNSAGIRNVPNLISGGDVACQCTSTRRYAQYGWNLDLPGPQLNTFQSSREFFQALRDVLVAHYEAYTRCHILHRNIGIAAVVFDQNRRGLLTNWEMATTIAPSGQSVSNAFPAKALDPLHFLSIRLLQDNKLVHDVRDDVEGFFYLVLYYCIRYMPIKAANYEPRSVSGLIRYLFDNNLGSHPRFLFVVRGELSNQEPLNLANVVPMYYIRFAMAIIKDWYHPFLLTRVRGTHIYSYHDEFVGMLNHMLATLDWPLDDAADDAIAWEPLVPAHGQPTIFDDCPTSTPAVHGHNSRNNGSQDLVAPLLVNGVPLISDRLTTFSPGLQPRQFVNPPFVTDPLALLPGDSLAHSVAKSREFPLRSAEPIGNAFNSRSAGMAPPLFSPLDSAAGNLWSISGTPGFAGPFSNIPMNLPAQQQQQDEPATQQHLLELTNRMDRPRRPGPGKARSAVMHHTKPARRRSVHWAHPLEQWRKA